MTAAPRVSIDDVRLESQRRSDRLARVGFAGLGVRKADHVAQAELAHDGAHAGGVVTGGERAKHREGVLAALRRQVAREPARGAAQILTVFLKRSETIARLWLVLIRECRAIPGEILVIRQSNRAS